MAIFSGKYQGNITIGDGYSPGGDFPIVSAEHVYVPKNITADGETTYQGESLDARLEELESKISSNVVVDTSLNDSSANPIANSAVCAALKNKSDAHAHPYAAQDHTHYSVKDYIEEPLVANTQYYLSAVDSDIKFTFPKESDLGDEIFIQFFLKKTKDGAVPVVSLINVYSMSSVSYSSNSVVEIHAVYGIVPGDNYRWNVAVYQNKVGEE